MWDDWWVAFLSLVILIFVFQYFLFRRRAVRFFTANGVAQSRKRNAAALVNDQLLEAIFDDAPVPMLLVNHQAALVKINKAAKVIGITKSEELVGLQPGDALNCIHAAYGNSGCGNGKECNKCRFRQTIQDTLTNKTAQHKIPVLMNIRRDADTPFNFLLSTSYMQLDTAPMVLIVMEDVTSIVRAERALIDSEFRYKQITRAITDYIYTVIVNENSEISTIHTPACVNITGYQPEEFERNPMLWFEIIYESDRQYVIDFIRNTGDSREKNLIEHRIVKKNGDMVWVSNTLVLKAYRANRNIRYDGILRDITERKVAEQALEKQVRLFNTMLETLPIGIFMISSANGKPLLANKHAKVLLGKGIVEDAGLNNLNIVYNAYRAGTNEFYPRGEMPVYLGLQGIESRIDDMEVQHPDGTRVLLEVVGCPVYDDQNNLYASLVGFYDITERKNAEFALRQSEKKLSLIFEHSHIGIALSDESGNIQYMNSAFCKLLDCNSGEAVGKNFRLFTYPGDVDREIALFNKLRKKEANILNFEKQYVRQNGEGIWVQLQVSCFRDRKDEVTNFIAIAEDISERKKSTDLLRASEEKFRNIFNASNDGILITDLQGNILEVNRITEERSGYPLEVLCRFNILDMIDVNDREIARLQLSMIKDKVGVLQTSYTNKRGEKIHIEIVGHTIRYNGQEAILMISRDISERLAMQQKIMNAIIEAEEKERTFFSQELHDGIGPILSTVKLYLQWIQSPETRSDKIVLIDEALETIEEAIWSVKEISNKLSPNVLTKFGLETALRSYLRKLGNLNKVNFVLDIQLPQRIRQEIETMLYRVIVEAVNNSLKYANASNIYISISTTHEALTASFADDGIGFDPGSLEDGTGNGLFNMNNRVKTYEGTFLIDSTPGRGTRINISIPSRKCFITDKVVL